MNGTVKGLTSIFKKVSTPLPDALICKALQELTRIPNDVDICTAGDHGDLPDNRATGRPVVMREQDRILIIPVSLQIPLYM